MLFFKRKHIIDENSKKLNISGKTLIYSHEYLAVGSEYPCRNNKRISRSSVVKKLEVGQLLYVQTYIYMKEPCYMPVDPITKLDIGVFSSSVNSLLRGKYRYNFMRARVVEIFHEYGNWSARVELEIYADDAKTPGIEIHADETKTSGIETLYNGIYSHSKNFRGFKKIRLTTYDEKIVNDSIRKLISLNPPSDPFNVDGRTIQLEVIRDNATFTEPHYYLNVYVDGLRIGSGYDCREEYITHIISGHIDKVHVSIEDDDDRFCSNLFIHIADPDALVEGA